MGEYWSESGGLTGPWGAPLEEELCFTGTGGTSCSQRFEGGIVKWREGTGIIDCSVLTCLALTFDDGPGEDTSRLLDILESANVQATFFLWGEHVAGHEDDVARMDRIGMDIGNHTWDHTRMDRLGNDARARELESTSATIENLVHYRPWLFRPPYGIYDANLQDTAAAAGMALVFWDVDSLDWKLLDADAVIQRVMERVGRDKIVLLHDVHPTSVDAVPELIRRIEAEGYTLVTVSDITGPTIPGEIYHPEVRDW